MEKKILVIENNVEEKTRIHSELDLAGIENFWIASTLSEGLYLMPRYDALLSDLFFPAGSKSSEKYSRRFFPLYEQYKKKFEETLKDNLILEAIQSSAAALGVTPQDYVNEYMAKLDFPEFLLMKAQDSVAGVENSREYENFLKIEDGIRNGTDLPLGIIASERAKELGIAATIVTSTYHHSDAFEPIRNLISVPYRDSLIDGRKDWKGGIESLLK